MTLKKPALIYSLILAVTAVSLVVFLVLFLKPADKYKIPDAIHRQLSFPVLFLTNPTTTYKLDTGSIKYSSQADGTAIFSFVAYSTKNRITISEQAYPEVLIYDKLANSVNPYSEAGTLYGKATLGRPKDGGGRQTAVLKYSDSTLIFARPASDLSDPQWQILFNALNPIK